MVTRNDACRRRAGEVQSGTRPPWGSSHSHQGFCRWLHSLPGWNNSEGAHMRRRLMAHLHSRNSKARTPCGQVAAVAQAALSAVEAARTGRLTAEIHEEVCCCRCHKDSGSDRVANVATPAAAPKVVDRGSEAPELAVTLRRPTQRRRRRRVSSPKPVDRDLRRRISVTFNDE